MELEESISFKLYNATGDFFQSLNRDCEENYPYEGKLLS